MIPTGFLDSRLKGFPTDHPALAIAEAGLQGWELLRGDLMLPMAVLKSSALAHNLRWMADFCCERGLDLAPHGKTTMSPELWQRQIESGAWAISLATVFQASVAARHGVRRVLIPNQVLQWAELDALVNLQDEVPGWWVSFLVDSPQQVMQIEAWAQARQWTGRWPVLLEMGIPGQRTGCRDSGQALDLARRIHASHCLRLVGVECYEGPLASCDHDKDRAGVRELMDRVEAVARGVVAEQLCDLTEADGGALILSAGGSAIFDLVAERLLPDLGVPVRGVLRSGCYLTHDHSRYQRYLCCVGERLNLRETLRPAMEVLACVQSCPEPGLALLTMGKRDVGQDMGLPVPLWLADGRGGSPRTTPGHWHIDALNDQHAYLRFDPQAPGHEHPQVGQTVASGISHPCTTFDKWRWMPVVDDRYRVVAAITTWF
ncbi:MAG: amino acid deaminase [Hydrogenophaga sp.]|nr:amino acid deaminase [Hydrogenophaga sp.]